MDQLQSAIDEYKYQRFHGKCRKNAKMEQIIDIMEENGYTANKD